MTTGAIITAAVLSTAATGYSVYEGNKARKEAKKEADRQRQEQDRQQQELEDRRIAEEEKEASIQARRSRRTRAATTGARPRATILTSPLGVSGGQETTQKTLLGE